MPNNSHRIGFVSTRIAGTDGVSLEISKWASVLTQMGCECFYFAGELDTAEDRSYCVEEAHFQHPDILALTRDLFDDYSRNPGTSSKIQTLQRHLKKHLYNFASQFGIDVMIAENALSLPMNIPLGLALTEYAAETNRPMIGHHHDFFWERKRFSINAAGDYLRAAFPPVLPSVQHVVINSFAARQLSLRAGVSSNLVPNVMDFETPPAAPDDYAAKFRSTLGIEDDKYILLQPTRIVPRKRIEHSIEIARRLEIPVVLVISHASGDEGTAYADFLQEYAHLLGVELILGAPHINHRRSLTPEGYLVFSLADVYSQAGVVTYPSTLEGFGNAFLETIYHRRPLVMSDYEVFYADIRPQGFKVISFDEFITDETVDKVRNILVNPWLAEEMVDLNYQLGRKLYSFTALEKNLTALKQVCIRE